MKKIIATTLLVGSTFALSACDTASTGNIDTQPPYSLERTATHTKTPVVATPVIETRVVPAERVFQRAQTK